MASKRIGVDWLLWISNSAPSSESTWWTPGKGSNPESSSVEWRLRGLAQSYHSEKEESRLGVKKKAHMGVGGREQPQGERVQWHAKAILDCGYPDYAWWSTWRNVGLREYFLVGAFGIWLGWHVKLASTFRAGVKPSGNSVRLSGGTFPDLTSGRRCLELVLIVESNQVQIQEVATMDQNIIPFVFVGKWQWQLWWIAFVYWFLQKGVLLRLIFFECVLVVQMDQKVCREYHAREKNFTSTHMFVWQ